MKISEVSKKEKDTWRDVQNFLCDMYVMWCELLTNKFVCKSNQNFLKSWPQTVE